jgi:4-amino-4-deoxy-L-arabinose transferase-like glycosyltransferase
MTSTESHATPAIDEVATGEPGIQVPPLYLKPVLAIVAGMIGVEMAVSARYGIHRDELYFLACARHLAWGYVDQPPFVPAVARVATGLFGPSAVALRVFPAVAGGASVLFTGAMARELGGGRQAQIVAALAAAASTETLATVHLLSTAAFDLFFWSAITLMVMRMLRTEERRWWLAIGAVGGIGLLNKYNVVFLFAGLAVGMVLSNRRRLLTNRWALLGGGIALIILSPNVIWNAQHHWAAISMLHSLQQENGGIGASVKFIPAQFVIVGPILIVLWIGGLVRLLRHPFARTLGISYLSLVVLDTLAGAKPYYLGGMYFVLFAAGGLWIEERRARRGRPGGLWRIVALIVVGEALLLPFALPTLPVDTLAKGPEEGNLNKDLSATVGWQQMTRQVADIASALPPANRAHLVVFTGDYGAAGAVDLYGSSQGLPNAISGHNNYWIWGPTNASDDSTTIAVNLSRAYLQTIFRNVVPAGSVNTPYGVWTEERGDPIWICTGQRVNWARAWPDAKHYG